MLERGRTRSVKWSGMSLVSDDHALYVGAVLGIAMKHGVPLRPVIDEDGNYTDQLSLVLPNDVVINVTVPPPPLDWSLDDWLIDV